MSARHARLALTLALLAATPCALAQERLPPSAANTTLALPAALEAARRNVPSIMSALGQAHAANAQIGLARAPLLPFVSASATLGAIGQNSWSNASSTMGTGTMCTTTGTGTGTGGTTGTPICSTNSGAFGYGYIDVGVTGRWTIWDFGRTALSVDAARQNARSAMADVRAVERSALAGAAVAYFAVLADQELVAADRETLQARERELEVAATRVSAGLDPEINRTRAAVAVQTARLELSTAMSNVRNDSVALAAALGFDPAHPPSVVQTGDIAVDDDPERAANAAVNARPEVIAARLRVASVQSQVAATRAAYRPALSTTGSLGGRASETVTGGQSVIESGTATLSFIAPIYDPTIAANIRIAEGNLETARAELAQQVLSVRADAVQSAIAVQSAREQLEEALRNAELTTANLQLSEGRFQAGTATILELVDAQTQDASARYTVVQRRFLLASAKIRLLASMDRLGDLEARH